MLITEVASGSAGWEADQLDLHRDCDCFLFNRLFEHALRHQNPSTFFRAIGAILGCRPVPGSLAGIKNQKNYKFSTNDTAEVVH